MPRSPIAALASAPLLRTAAAVAATVIAVWSAGSWVVLALALLLVAWDGAAAAALIGATVAVAARWGTTSLTALAGGQAVLGPGGLAGPPPAAASAWLVGAGILLVAPDGIWAVPGGLAAALIVAGPAASGATAAGVRLLAAVGGVELALAVGSLPVWTATPRRAAGALLAVIGAVVAVAGRPPGGGWSVEADELVRGAALAVAVGAATAVVVVVARRRTPALSGQMPGDVVPATDRGNVGADLG